MLCLVLLICNLIFFIITYRTVITGHEYKKNLVNANTKAIENKNEPINEKGKILINKFEKINKITEEIPVEQLSYNNEKIEILIGKEKIQIYTAIDKINNLVDIENLSSTDNSTNIDIKGMVK